MAKQYRPDKQTVIQRATLWAKENPEARKAITARYRTKINVREKTRNRTTKEEIVAFLGGRCTKCGFEDIRALQVDHINGKRHLPLKQRRRGGRWLYREILRHELPRQDIQLLCANCNWIKRYENNEVTGRDKNKCRI